MNEKRIIPGYFDEDGNELHYLDTVLYNDETYIIIEQKGDPKVILHPIGGNPNTVDIALDTVNYAVKKMSV